MDDLTDIPGVEQGDEAPLTAQVVAERLGANAYEVVASLLARVSRLS